MATSLNINAGITVNGGPSRNVTLTRDTTGDHFDFRKVTVTQSGEYTFTIDSALGNVRECLIVNSDATNYVQVGFATGVYYLRIEPGAMVLLSLEPATSALYMLANTADCECEIYVREV